METITVAVIGGAFTVIAALCSALVTRYGLSFWRPTKMIICCGKAKALRLGSGDDLPDIFTEEDWIQDLEEVRMGIRGDKSWITAMYTLRHGSNVRMHGKLQGSGVFVNGRAYMQYNINDKARSQHLSGVLLMVIPQWRDINGYYLAESLSAQGSTVLGHVHLSRPEH